MGGFGDNASLSSVGPQPVPTEETAFSDGENGDSVIYSAVDTNDGNNVNAAPEDGNDVVYTAVDVGSPVGIAVGNDAMLSELDANKDGVVTDAELFNGGE